MVLSTGWIVVIVVLVFAIVISNITLLKKSNKAFTFPENYEKKKPTSNLDKSDDDDKPSGLM